MEIINFSQHIILCFLLALCQVSLGAFWGTYMMQSPIVSGHLTGIFGLDITKLLCFSVLNYWWIILIWFFKVLIISLIEIIFPAYRKIILISNHEIISFIVKVLIGSIPMLTQSFFLRKYYKNKNINYIYFYFFITSLGMAIAYSYDSIPEIMKDINSKLEK